MELEVTLRNLITAFSSEKTTTMALLACVFSCKQRYIKYTDLYLFFTFYLYCI